MEEVHKKFTLDVGRVQRALESFIKAWDDLYVELTSSDSDKGRREKSVTGM